MCGSICVYAWIDIYLSIYLYAWMSGCCLGYLLVAIKSFTKPRARRAGAAVAVSYGRRLLRECREHAPAPDPAVPWHFRHKGFTASL